MMSMYRFLIMEVQNTVAGIVRGGEASKPRSLRLDESPTNGANQVVMYADFNGHRFIITIKEVTE